jgi:hypothetical protein
LVSGDSAVEIDVENKYVKVYTKNERERDIILSKLRSGLKYDTNACRVRVT